MKFTLVPLFTFFALHALADLPPVKRVKKSKIDILNGSPLEKKGVVRLPHKLEDFKKNLKKGMLFADVVNVFGEPARNIGSGINIYVYETDTGESVMIGVPGSEIMYVSVQEPGGKSYKIVE